MNTFQKWLEINLNNVDSDSIFTKGQSVEYFTRFNLEIGEISRNITDGKMAKLIDHLYGSGSFYMNEVAHLPASNEVSLFFNSIESLYSNLFDVKCSHYFSHLDYGPEVKNPLNGPCYMLWDMDGGIDSFRFSGVPEHIEASISLLERLSLGSTHPATIESSIHGLGHMIDDFRPLCAPILEKILLRDDLPTELLEYADDALNHYIL